MAENEKKVVEAASKKSKPAKEKGKVKSAWKGFKSELKKITWPTGKQVFKNTLVVLAVVVSAAIVIGALDLAFNFGFTSLVELLMNAKQG